MAGRPRQSLMASDHFGASLSAVLRAHGERVRLSRKARRERQVIEAILDEDVAEARVEASQNADGSRWMLRLEGTLGEGGATSLFVWSGL